MRAAHRGAGAAGAPRSGKSPDAIIANRSLAHSLNVSSWRDGVRASLRLVWRVITAMGVSVVSLPLGAMRRSTGTARTRVGVSSYQVGMVESLIFVVSKAAVDLRGPLRLDGLPDEVAVEESRRAGGARVRHRDETVVGARHPQHDVGECEVGEQLPVADQQMQPFDVGLIRSTLGEHEIGER